MTVEDKLSATVKNNTLKKRAGSFDSVTALNLGFFVVGVYFTIVLVKMNSLCFENSFMCGVFMRNIVTAQFTLSLGISVNGFVPDMKEQVVLEVKL